MNEKLLELDMIERLQTNYLDELNTSGAVSSNEQANASDCLDLSLEAEEEEEEEEEEEDEQVQVQVQENERAKAEPQPQPSPEQVRINTWESGMASVSASARKINSKSKSNTHFTPDVNFYKTIKSPHVPHHDKKDPTINPVPWGGGDFGSHTPRGGQTRNDSHSKHGLEAAHTAAKFNSKVETKGSFLKRQQDDLKKRTNELAELTRQQVSLSHS